MNANLISAQEVGKFTFLGCLNNEVGEKGELMLNVNHLTSYFRGASIADTQKDDASRNKGL